MSSSGFNLTTSTVATTSGLSTSVIITNTSIPTSTSQSSSAQINATTTADAAPFFPSPTESASSQQESSKSRLAKPILGGLFGFIVLFVVFFLLYLRWRRLRQSNRSLRFFFHGDWYDSGSFHRTSSVYSAPFPRTTGLPPVPPSHRRPISLTPSLLYPHLSNARLPLSTSNTRAADIDQSGRRVGQPNMDDRLGEASWDEKDTLPAYDNLGGPPRYLDHAELREHNTGLECGDEIVQSDHRAQAEDSELPEAGDETGDVERLASAVPQVPEDGLTMTGAYRGNSYLSDGTASLCSASADQPPRLTSES